MAAKVSVVNVQPMGNQLRVVFKLILTGNYPTGGDVVDFTTPQQDPSFIGTVPSVVDATGPAVTLDIWDQSGDIANGVFPVIGTAQNNNKVKFTTAFNTELGAGAYPGGLLAANVVGEAIFNKV